MTVNNRNETVSAYKNVTMKHVRENTTAEEKQ
jgi:hypothetical protein